MLQGFFFGKKGSLGYTMGMLNIYQQQNKDELEVASAVPARPSIASYEDPTGEFDNKQLKYGMWWLKNRSFLERLLTGGVATVAALLWVFSLWSWGVFFVQWNNHATVLQSLTRFSNYAAAHAVRAPNSLAIVTTQILPSGVGKNDAVAEVVNPNTQFFVEFDYQFIVGGVPTPLQRAALLPGENRLIAALGLDENQSGGDVSLRLDNVAWQRISNHDVKDPINWQKERLDFTVDNFVFSNSETAELGVHSISFRYANNSAYSYVGPAFYIGLYNREALVGVLPLSFSEFRSQETKNVDVRTFVKNIDVDAVRVFPLINVYDSSVYLPPSR